MKLFLFAIVCLFLAARAAAIIKYDEGALFINGVTLLQDRENPKDYYYLPQYPRLATKEDGTLEFLCIKYIGEKAEGNGGLFHALIEFSLPADLITSITK